VERIFRGEFRPRVLVVTSTTGVLCRGVDRRRVSSYSPRQREGGESKPDFRRAAPAVRRSVSHSTCSARRPNENCSNGGNFQTCRRQRFPVAWQNLAVVRYLKALGVGLLSAMAAAVLYSAVREAWAFSYVALVLAPRAEAASDGLSWDAFYPQSFDLRGSLIIGFVLGFWWMLRRQAVAPR
jgi:hypothetical protein